MFGCQEGLEPLIMGCTPARASLIGGTVSKGSVVMPPKAVAGRVWVGVGTVDMMVML